MSSDTRVEGIATCTTHGVSARPARWVGAPAPGGLTLPSALPTASQMYAPRGVWIDEQRLIVCDTGNHRIMIWHDHPDRDHADADVVLGQQDFTCEGAQADGRGPANGMRLPTGVAVHDGRLIVADAWNHRLLLWDEIPARSDVAPDWVIGQPDSTSVDENAGIGCGPHGFYWPFGIAVIGGDLYVADTGNRRVVVFDGVPTPGAAPRAVIGQPSATDRDENRGELGPASFRWPHDIAGGSSADDSSGPTIFVADAGNHRVLGWHVETDRPADDRDADLVLGQRDFTTGTEFPYAPQSNRALRFPYAIAIDDGAMAVADTANNRILWWEHTPTTSDVPADGVLAQPTFEANGENRWDAVRHDSLCWPYGISLRGRHLAVADSGNNRVMIWDIDR